MSNKCKDSTDNDTSRLQRGAVMGKRRKIVLILLIVAHRVQGLNILPNISVEKQNNYDTIVLASV